jgi:hypothetical protein
MSKNSTNKFDFSYVENYLTGIQDAISNALQKEKYRIENPIEIRLRTVVKKVGKDIKVWVIEIDQKAEAYQVSEITVKLNRIAENEKPFVVTSVH